MLLLLFFLPFTWGRHHRASATTALPRATSLELFILFAKILGSVLSASRLLFVGGTCGGYQSSSIQTKQRKEGKKEGRAKQNEWRAQMDVHATRSDIFFLCHLEHVIPIAVCTFNNATLP
jgi:hypothetical protein